MVTLRTLKFYRFVNKYVLFVGNEKSNFYSKKLCYKLTDYNNNHLKALINFLKVNIIIGVNNYENI
jgi:hypothetical protein